MCGPSEVLTSIPGITGTDGSVSLMRTSEVIRLWSVMATPVPRDSASAMADSTRVNESEQSVWKCMSTAMRPLSRIASQSGVSKTASIWTHLMQRVRQMSSEAESTSPTSIVVIAPSSTTTSPWQRTVLTLRLLPE